MKQRFLVECFLLMGIVGASAADIIKPFGALTWTDGTADVVAKLSAIEGIEKVALHVKFDSKPLPIKSITNNVALGNSILPALIEEMGEAFGPKKREESSFDYDLDFWSDASNNKHKYFRSTFKFMITAEPIIIHGVPFKLSAYLMPSAGFGFKYPNKVISIKGSDYEFPMCMTDVILKSTSPLLEEKCRAITEQLAMKYKEMWVSGDLQIADDGSALAKANDKEGRELALDADPIAYEIAYRNDHDIKQMNDEYNKHLRALQRKLLEGKKDSKSEL